MENYLLDERCSLSNNTFENAICPFTVGRKNWLFVDTPKGTDAFATIYSLVETAKANGLKCLCLSSTFASVHARYRMAMISRGTGRINAMG